MFSWGRERVHWEQTGKFQTSLTKYRPRALPQSHVTYVTYSKLYAPQSVMNFSINLNAIFLLVIANNKPNFMKYNTKATVPNFTRK